MTKKEKAPEQTRSFVGVVIIAVVVLLVITGVGVYALVGRLSDQAIWAIAGSGLTLIILGAAISLLLVKDLAQAYLVHRLSGQQQIQQTRELALLARLASGRAPVTNIRTPAAKQIPWNVQMSQENPVIDGEYRQTFSEGLEIQ